MQKSDDLIVVTGGAGFIGSCLIADLNQKGFQNILVVDDFNRLEKIRNLGDKKITGLKHRDDFLIWLDTYGEEVHMVYHIGARTDTAESDSRIFDELNLEYSKRIWKSCSRLKIPLLYASSAATYGLGESGYQDRHDLVDRLVPLNPYGRSKNDFDAWALRQTSHPPHWYGLKFFNVFGPNEYHKGRMASVIFHTHRQIQKTGAMKLFRSHRADIQDGQQSRDFIYIKDLLKMIDFFSRNRPESGLYNCGTGTARTFYDLATGVFSALKMEPKISFIDTPLDIRETYQYFTQADLSKVRAAGYSHTFMSLEKAIHDYVTAYLETDSYA
ncbi:MAG: ADP-glyceromanno-heptose 6-epimerase [Saprospiraceae bacterium]|nr:ADP-glyceromanno-heptose 6-epimerase [Saprospiraceae bacterium]